jgi:hypothetical protein
MGGQIVDATLVQAPRQRMTQEEKDAAKAGKTAAQTWPDKPAKAAQKDTHARWTVKFTKAKERPDGSCCGCPADEHSKIKGIKSKQARNYAGDID